MQRITPSARHGVVVVVEDDDAITALIKELLDAEGHRCLSASTADEAQQLVDTELPDLLIVDVILSGVAAGWKLLDQLGRNQHTSAIPIIVCTADTSSLSSHQAVFRERGIRLLAKPFDIDDLLRLVGCVMESRATRAPAGLPVSAQSSISSRAEIAQRASIEL